MTYPKNLKYPYNEYIKLIEVLKQLAPYFELDKIQPNQLHYLAYQQTNEAQSHNKLHLTSQGLKKTHTLNNISVKDASPIVTVNFELDLYPNDCNDNHIETVMKRAVKEVLTNPTIKHYKI